MTASPAQAFAEAVRAEPVDLGEACALLAAALDPRQDAGGTGAALDALAARVDRSLPPVEALRRVLGGFSGDAAAYAELESSLLPAVLERHRGLPILLSVVWLEVARRCAIPAEGVGLPGHFVVRVGGELVDPFHGGAPFPHPGPPPPGWPATDILARILNNVRAWAVTLDRVRVRLAAVELSLALPRHPLELRHERGQLLARVGDFSGAAAELEAYAEAVEPADAGRAETARREARLTRARLN